MGTIRPTSEETTHFVLQILINIAVNHYHQKMQNPHCINLDLPVLLSVAACHICSQMCAYAKCRHIAYRIICAMIVDGV